MAYSHSADALAGVRTRKTARDVHPLDYFSYPEKFVIHTVAVALLAVTEDASTIPDGIGTGSANSHVHGGNPPLALTNVMLAMRTIVGAKIATLPML